MERIAAAISSGKNTHLKSISASGHPVPPRALSALASAIASAPQKIISGGIQSIAIGDREMGDSGLIALCSTLEPYKGGTLETLDMSFKGITKIGMEVLGACFGASECVSSLNLSRNEEVSDDGVEIFCKTALRNAPSEPFAPLEYLDLSRCNIGPCGVRSLSECFVDGEKKVRGALIDLMLVSNPLGKESCISLSKLISSPSHGKSSLVSLSLARCSIGDNGIEILVDSTKMRQCQGLKKLDLSHNNIGTFGAQKLSEALGFPKQESMVSLVDLRELCLNGNPLGSDGVCALTSSLVQREGIDAVPGSVGNSTLSVLDLSETACGSEGAIAALQCGRLSTLYLFNNKLGSLGFESIVPSLQGGHPSLQSLDLGGNNAKEPAVVRLLQAFLLKGNELNAVKSMLRTLIVGGNEFGEEVEKVLKVVNEAIPELDIAHDRPGGPAQG